MSDLQDTSVNQNKDHAPRKSSNKPSFADTCKSTCQTLHHHLGVAGWISVGTLFIVIIFIATSGHRNERFGRGCEGAEFDGRMMNNQRNFPFQNQGRQLRQRIFQSIENDGNDIFDQVDNQIQQRVRQQETMMNRVFNDNIHQPTIQANSASISLTNNGLSGSSVQYHLNSSDGEIKGSYSSLNTTGLQAIATQIKNLGLQVNQNDTTISFQGKLDDINTLLQILK